MPPRYAGAIRHFQQALRLNPKYALAHYNWGNALRAQRDYTGAIRHYQQALELDPNLAAAHTNWGVALAEKRDYAGAMIHYQQRLVLGLMQLLFLQLHPCFLQRMKNEGRNESQIRRMMMMMMNEE